MDRQRSLEIVTSALRKTGISRILATPGEVEITYNAPWKKADIIEAIEETGYIVVNY